MINKHLNETINSLLMDAKFLEDLPEKKDEYVKDGQLDMSATKRLFSWLFHIVDYNVTANLIDMDADLLRLCESDPKKAKELSDSLNTAAMIAKSNYQVAFEDESCEDITLKKLLTGQYDYENATMKSILPLLPFSYCVCLGAYIDIKKGASPLIWQDPFFTYEDMEFILADNNIDILEKKYEASKNLDFSVNQVKSFIDSSFAWGDKIQEYLNRMRQNKTIVEIDIKYLNKLYARFNGIAFDCPSSEKFAKAIMNIEMPDFEVKTKEILYAILFCLYNKLGILGPRSSWIKAILKNFKLDENNYNSAVSKFKDYLCRDLNKRKDNLSGNMKKCLEEIEDILMEK